MTNYSAATTAAAIVSSDTLNQAIGKLEKRIALLEAALGGMKLVKLTTAQYNEYEAQGQLDDNTLYIIND
jgi:hypothetical protein